jgi:hypothetical protein
LRTATRTDHGRSWPLVTSGCDAAIDSTSRLDAASTRSVAAVLTSAL